MDLTGNLHKPTTAPTLPSAVIRLPPGTLLVPTHERFDPGATRLSRRRLSRWRDVVRTDAEVDSINARDPPTHGKIRVSATRPTADRLLGHLELDRESPTLDYLHRIIREHQLRVPFETLTKLLDYEPGLRRGDFLPSIEEYVER